MVNSGSSSLDQSTIDEIKVDHPARGLHIGYEDWINEWVSDAGALGWTLKPKV